jgi:hypothetical protein
VDDVGAEVLGAWREYDVGGGVSDARFALFCDTPVKGDRFVTWFVTWFVCNAAVAALMRVYWYPNMLVY